MSKDGRPSGLYLGYDAGCLKCSTIATRIEDEVGDQLTLIPLASPQMRGWREELLGEDARWAPTLVRVSGEQERAYGASNSGHVFQWSSRVRSRDLQPRE